MDPSSRIQRKESKTPSMEISDRLSLRKAVRKESNKLRNWMFLGEDPKEHAINEFPEQWHELIPGAAHLVKGAHLPSEASAVTVIHHVTKDGKTKGHLHQHASESIFVVKGKVIVHEPTGDFVLGRKDWHVIDEDVAHSYEYTAGTIFIKTWLINSTEEPQ